MRVWTPTWAGMENFIEPNGHIILQKLIDSLEQYDVALNNSDFMTLEGLYLTSAKWERELLPFTKSIKFSNTLTHASDACKSIAKKIENGGNLIDVAIFEKQQLINVHTGLNLK